jgi:hypothetical protein
MKSSINQELAHWEVPIAIGINLGDSPSKWHLPTGHVANKINL